MITRQVLLTSTYLPQLSDSGKFVKNIFEYLNIIVQCFRLRSL